VRHPILGGVRVSRQEIDALVGVLDYYIPDLHAEIARTEHADLRRRLRAQEAQLCGLRQRLLASRELAADGADAA
jgi:hypothetical protein